MRRALVLAFQLMLVPLALVAGCMVAVLCGYAASVCDRPPGFAAPADAALIAIAAVMGLAGAALIWDDLRGLFFDRDA